MANFNAAEELKQSIEKESENQAEVIRLTSELSLHERQATEFAAEAAAVGCNSMDELRTLFGASEAEDKRAVAEHKTAVNARADLLKSIRDKLAQVGAPGARG